MIIKPFKNDIIFIALSNGVSGRARVNFWSEKDESGLIWTSVYFDELGDINIQSNFIVFYRILSELKENIPKETNQYVPEQPQYFERPEYKVEKERLINSIQVEEDENAFNTLNDFNIKSRAKKLSKIKIADIKKDKEQIRNKLGNSKQTPITSHYQFPTFKNKK